MDEKKLKDQNILLVKEKDSNELKAVAGIGKDGKLETVEANAENAFRFLTFDRNNRNELAGIMSDFNRRADNPKDFQLFQVRYGKIEKLKEGLEEVLSAPHHPEAKDYLKPYESQRLCGRPESPIDAGRRWQNESHSKRGSGR